MQRFAFACAVAASLIAARAQAQSHGARQTIDIDFGTGFGGVQTYDLGSHPFSLDATLPSAGLVQERQMGRDIGLGRYVFGSGGASFSIGFRSLHFAIGGGFFSSGGGPTIGTIGGFTFGQSVGIAGGYVDPQLSFRVRLGTAGDLELRPGVRVGGESVSIPITGPTSACPINCGSAIVHYDDLIVVPHFGITWLGGFYDHDSPMAFEIGIGVDVGVMVYPELGFQAQLSFTMRMPIILG